MVTGAVVVVAVLVVEVELDAVVEVSLLQHLAQLARANLCLQLFLYLKVLKLVLFGPAAMMVAGSVEFRFLNDLFLHQAASWGEGRNRGHRRVLVWFWRFRG